MNEDHLLLSNKINNGNQAKYYDILKM